MFLYLIVFTTVGTTELPISQLYEGLFKQLYSFFLRTYLRQCQVCPTLFETVPPRDPSSSLCGPPFLHGPLMTPNSKGRTRNLENQIYFNDVSVDVSVDIYDRDCSTAVEQRNELYSASIIIAGRETPFSETPTRKGGGK